MPNPQLEGLRVTCPECLSKQELMVSGEVPPSTLVRCTSCHKVLADWAILRIASTAAQRSTRVDPVGSRQQVPSPNLPPSSSGRSTMRPSLN